MPVEARTEHDGTNQGFCVKLSFQLLKVVNKFYSDQKLQFWL